MKNLNPVERYRFFQQLRGKREKIGSPHVKLDKIEQWYFNQALAFLNLQHDSPSSAERGALAGPVIKEKHDKITLSTLISIIVP